MFRSDGEGAGPASPRTTIVGGRPPEAQGGLPPVPIGLERLLRLAAVDPAFGAELIARRVEVAAAAGVDLTRSEAAILAAIPAAQLEAMIARVPPPAPSGRREFLQQAAASAVVALGGAALASCEVCGPTTRGIQPDLPPERPVEPMPPTGIAPDVPPPRPEVNQTATDGGAAPDVPPPRPDVNQTASEGGAAPDVPPPRPVYVDPAAGQVPAVPPRPATPNATRGIRPDDPDDGFK
jgi:hypothetical protein